jgi:hypothetical protein
MPRQHLTSDQIRGTLRRHGYAENTLVLGVSYTDQRVTVNIASRQLIVPRDVLEDRPVITETGQRTLFSRPA